MQSRLSNKKHIPVETELFIRGRLNYTHNLIIKILNKRELQQFTI